jgi:hypothetical protein
MKNLDRRDMALRAAGRLAVSARAIVGGRDHNGQKWGAATVHSLRDRCERLSSALAEYDAEILALMREDIPEEREA